MRDPVIELLETLVEIARGGFKQHVVDAASGKDYITFEVTPTLHIKVEFVTGLLYHVNGEHRLVAYCGPNIAGLRHSLFQELVRLVQLQTVQHEPWLAVIKVLKDSI